MLPLSVTWIRVAGFRNLAAHELSFGERFNVISGDNGQGKTNLLEALYLVSTSRSFRTSKLAELVHHGETLASVRAKVRLGDDAREQSMGLSGGSRQVRIDGKRPKSLAAFAIETPMVVFHPGEISLSMGAGSERRRLLDRLALYIDPSSLASLERYGKALRARQKTLETRGIEARDLEGWEDILVQHGLEIMHVRARAAAELCPRTVRAFGEITGLPVAVSYEPGAPDDETTYRHQLRESRVKDARRGSTSIGPQRDDLALRLQGQPARGFASQGQHRALVLALKSAEIEVVGAARGRRPVLLLDDVSSELDPSRTDALFRFLRGHHGQVFLTTTRREMITTGELGGEERRDFRVEGGMITPLRDAP